MKIETVGSGDAEIGVVYCVHGDEPSGKKAVDRLLEENICFIKTVKFVLANERALEKNKRFIDCDLNRSFPGNIESDLYEERLASKLIEELEGLKVLDIHATGSNPVPFALFSRRDKKTFEAVKDTGLEKIVEISYTPGCGVNFYGGVEIELGPKESKNAEEMAYKLLKQFLVNAGAIEGECSYNTVEVFEVFDEEEKNSENWVFTAVNFQRVNEGEKFAESLTQKKMADKEFYPVLMSESYEEILGFKSVKNEKLTEQINTCEAE